LKYEDMTLFAHQKELFTICKQRPEEPKLVLYIAPTGTGKTLSPIGLSEQFRVIFVCVARHVGLALAKSAISVEKKIAFAFGCETASDIRLHYFAASTYTKNRKSGGIGKVDNSAGEKVEIMICDVKSYITAMHYMLAFNPEERIITYWDEPTITMDYEEHELHPVIHKNWKENVISKMVLSCATLPREEEISDTIDDFRSRFSGANIHMITSHDCKKSISILNKKGECTLPHLLFSKYTDLLTSVSHCEKNQTLLRYFDLKEIIRFVDYLTKQKFIETPQYNVTEFFSTISEFTMTNIKLYYLAMIKHIDPQKWPIIHAHMTSTVVPKFKQTRSTDIRKVYSMDASPNGVFKSTELTRTQSVQILKTDPPSSVPDNSAGILFTTKDAYTLTDGPTIFLADDVVNVGKFYIQETNIPKSVLHDIMEKIGSNSQLHKRIHSLEKSLEDKIGKEAEKEKKMENDKLSPEARKLENEIKELRAMIKPVTLDSVYIPNTKLHQQICGPDGEVRSNPYSPRVDEQSIRDVMELEIDDDRKLLLLLGIGLFDKMDSSDFGMCSYREVLKRLAYDQKLYMIIASSDYIYGTNYQFCHGIVGDDLANMTQQKTIQAMGRIGRSNIQQEYTVRFRDDDILKQLFWPIENNMEARVMSRLFC